MAWLEAKKTGQEEKKERNDRRGHVWLVHGWPRKWASSFPRYTNEAPVIKLPIDSVSRVDRPRRSRETSHRRRWCPGPWTSGSWLRKPLQGDRDALGRETQRCRVRRIEVAIIEGALVLLMPSHNRNAKATDLQRKGKRETSDRVIDSVTFNGICVTGYMKSVWNTNSMQIVRDSNWQRRRFDSGEIHAGNRASSIDDVDLRKSGDTVSRWREVPEFREMLMIPRNEPMRSLLISTTS